MGNFNVLITNPQGERSHHFHENVTRSTASKWLFEYGPAPIGWQYQIVNLNKKPRKQTDHILIQGFSKDGDLVGQVKARQKTNYGWYTVRMAKRDLRKQGASYFTQEKVWDHATETGNGAASEGDVVQG